MTVEEWREVVVDDDTFNGLYEVSNLGRIRRKDTKNLLQGNVHYYGYRQTQLSNKGKKKRYFTHRLVANAFIPNPQHLPQINHKNEDKLDNRAENLEWSTAKYNANYGNRNRKHSITNLKGKRILCIETNEVFETYMDIQEAYHIPKQNIRFSCNSCGKYGACGYHFKYLNNS